MVYVRAVFTCFISSLFVIMLGGVAFACSPTAEICVTKSCDRVGTTTIDYDKKNIIACLFDDSDNLVWKSTSYQQNITTGSIAHGHVVPLPSGKTASQCTVFVAPQRTYFPPSGDSGMWSDNHFGGIIGSVDPVTRKVTCGFYISFWDVADPAWQDGVCSYLVACGP